jgi:mono/diheme cytochrome c family protein
VVRKAGSGGRRRARAVGVLLTMALIGVTGCSDDSTGSGPGGGGTTSGSPASDARDVEPAPGADSPSASLPPSAQAAVPAVADSRTREELIKAGRGTYNANCIACHAMDPRRDGALGPAVAGASAALLEARVVRGDYPPGYTPKRPTRVMIALPHLEPKLPELVAYLQSLE